MHSRRALIATLLACAAPAVAAGPADAATARNCPAGQLCLFDGKGYQGNLAKVNCVGINWLISENLGVEFRYRASSAINRCPNTMLLVGRKSTLKMYRGQWIADFGGKRRFDNAAGLVKGR